MTDTHSSAPILENIFSLQDIKLPHYDLEKLGAFYRELSQRAEKQMRGFRGGIDFKKRRTELENAIRRHISLEKVMVSPRYVRPLFSLWLDQNFGESYIKTHCPPTAALLALLDRLIHSRPAKSLGVLALVELCQVFFMRFNSLGDLRDRFGQFVQKHLGLRTFRRNSFGLGELKNSAKFLFTNVGHKWLGEEAVKRGLPLVDMAGGLGISRNSELLRAALAVSFIQRIRELKPNEPNDVFHELLTSRTYELPWEGAQKIGHAVLIVMIDKLRNVGAAPNQQWKDIITHIAGDPRVPVTHQNYVQWWSVLGEERLQLMRSWLSRFDMTLFLNIINEFAKTNSEIKRMFERRKALLEHIFRHNRVSMTRLFVGAQTERFLKEWFKDKEMPFYTRQSQSNLTVFYYRIGDVHVVEGTHSFAMRILDKLPPDCAFERYDDYVRVTQLHSGLEQQYKNAFGSFSGLASITHHSSWIFNAVRILKKRGVTIKEQELFATKKDYLDYMRGD